MKKRNALVLFALFAVGLALNGYIETTAVPSDRDGPKIEAPAALKVYAPAADAPVLFVSAYAQPAETIAQPGVVTLGAYRMSGYRSKRPEVTRYAFGNSKVNWRSYTQRKV